MQTRRQLLQSFGAASFASCAPAHSQTKQGLPLVAILWHGSKDRELANPFFGWVMEGFEAVGLKPNVTIRVQHFFADESDARYAVLAPEMVDLNPDILIAIAGPPTVALKKVHGTIPLMFYGSPDPIGFNIVDNLSKRSENITGASTMGNELLTKRVALLHEALPRLSKVALIVNPKTKYQTDADLAESVRAAKSSAVLIRPFELYEPDDIAQTFKSIREWNAEAVVLSQTPAYSLFRMELAHAALDTQLPLMGWIDQFVAAGAFAAYGASIRDLFVGGGVYVKRILSGERAGDLPVTQPTRFHLTVNNKTADALGLTLPWSFVARVDRFID